METSRTPALGPKFWNGKVSWGLRSFLSFYHIFPFTGLGIGQCGDGWRREAEVESGN